MTYNSFPNLPSQAWSVFKEPFWDTWLQRGVSKREKRVMDQPVPLWRWELTFDVLRDEWDTRANPSGLGIGYDELRSLAGFYLQQQGPLVPFLFNDPTDNSVTSQTLGTGDGVTTVFQLGRTIGNYFEPIYYVTGVSAVYLNGSLTTAYTLTTPSEPGAYITFNTPPASGVIVSASFTYSWLVRFSDTEMDFENFMCQLWQAKKVRFQQTRPSAGAAAVQPGITCVSNFIYRTTNAPTNIVNMPFVDVNGAAYYVNYQIDASGNVYEITTSALRAAIDAWFGSSVVNGTGGTPPVLTPIHSGQYVLAWFNTEDATIGITEEWLAVSTPLVSGMLNIVGAIRYVSGLFGPPYPNPPRFYESNNQTLNDPILALGQFGLAGGNTAIMVLPSINTMISGVYKASGYGGSYSNPCEVPNVHFNGFTPATLGEGLFLATGGTADETVGPAGGFTLPDNNGGTNFYMYFNHSYMDFCTGTGADVDQEVHNVLQPAYPNGCIIKIPLGVLNWETLAASPPGAAPQYVVDNANWIDQYNNAQIPFADEYHYITTGVAGGQDCYRMQPGTVIPRGDGSWYVIFLMPGIDDAATNHTNYVNFAVRVFQYQPSTQVATQIFYQFCQVWTLADLPYVGGFWVLHSALASLQGSNLWIYGCVTNGDVPQFFESQ